MRTNGVNGVAQKKSDVAMANKAQKITRFVLYSVNARIAIEVYSHAGVTPEVSQILPVCRCLKYFLPAGRVHNVLAKVLRSAHADQHMYCKSSLLTTQLYFIRRQKSLLRP